MEVLILERTEFDVMENRHPLSTTILKVFVDEEHGLTAHGKAADWLAAQSPMKMYLGWDGNVYPRFTLRRPHHETLWA